ncbi:probable inactive leucine-rich repeat receptor kinase XIAO [Dendrobium catenatum]|uniref:Putative LRR receptor-like serine/threonine-protein kinase n=1 Tax=Dendrobium catenatum TaxID=906689 RepID=A0A2I0X754_9ASPA|nr:probable inactive leucine-rich repeat receptor kinase XIAO [Dendrobium catenatum]PKU83726.1 putative LRR receptor-like serine/threonine-protein kinase [Dendrobium catenatum]
MNKTSLFVPKVCKKRNKKVRRLAMPPRSVAFLFLVLLRLFVVVVAAQQPGSMAARQTEIDALTAFRLNLQDPLGVLSGWDGSADSAPCAWRGITCSPVDGGPVVEVRLPRLRLSGPISDRLADLRFLRKLSLPSNLFTGTIPSSLSKLSDLRTLFLQYNSLNGPLPPALLSNLTKLQILNAAGNRLSGVVPVVFLPNLRYLDLSSNSFSGQIPTNLSSMAPRVQLLNLSFNRLRGTIPGDLGRLQMLLYLWLDWNELEGTIPAVLANCSSLLHLSLQGNKLQGIVPSAVGEIPTLQVLSLSHNRLSGPIPSSIFYNASAAHPPMLRIVQLGYNALSYLPNPPEDLARAAFTSSVLQVFDVKENQVAGPFPVWLSNISKLTVLDLSRNSFSGDLPPEMGRLLSLQELRLGMNSMSGNIPTEIGMCSSLHVLELEHNRFSGLIPSAFGDLREMRTLLLGGNLFSGSIPSSLGGLSHLDTLSLWQNKLGGSIPEEILRLSNLTSMDLSGNRFSGEIPASIGNLEGLQSLNLSNNFFSGSIPSTIGKLGRLKSLDLSGQGNLSGDLPAELFGMPNLQVISLAENSFSGEFPEGFTSLWSLQRLNLTSNSFKGGIPPTYGYLQSLQVLSISKNNLSGQIPAELGNCSNLTTIQLQENHLSGSIPPDLSRLSNLEELDLSENFLSGGMPTEISQCSSLSTLLLDKNNLSGSIPETLSNLSKLQRLDLSSNNFSGTIPASLAVLNRLNYFNVSSNNLEGEIPPMLSSRFENASLFDGNPALCGQPLANNCGGKKRWTRSILFISLAAALAVITLTTVYCCCVCFVIRWRQRFLERRDGPKKRSPGRGSGSSSGSAGENGGPKLIMFQNKITYAETLEATRQFDEENVLSRGRHGLVFKACYSDGTVLSILRLPSTSADGAVVVEEGFFRKEAESLGKVKHRNLTVLRGYYAGPPPDVRLLIYDYMPNGNLATLLQEASHQDGHVLNWPMRHLIALGVARGLAFLHSANVVHGDVKPQNVLFDADFEPHLSDFGLERMTVTAGAAAEAAASTSSAAAGVVGSLGYVAPDAAAAGQATREGDVFSFGIVLLELLTGRRPGTFTGEEEEEDIVKWVKRQLQRGQITELLEPGLLELDPESAEWEEFLLGIKVGLLCTAPGPAERPTMADVVFMLEGCRVGPDIPSSTDPTSQPSPS